MKRTALIIAFSLTGLLCASAIAKHHDDNWPVRANLLESKVAQRLDLSDSQKAQIQAIIDQRIVRPEKSELREDRDALTALVQTTEGFDEDKARDIITAQHARELEHKLSALAARHQIWNVLTASQQETLNELMSRRKGDRHNRQ